MNDIHIFAEEMSLYDIVSKKNYKIILYAYALSNINLYCFIWNNHIIKGLSLSHEFELNTQAQRFSELSLNFQFK